MIYGYHLAFSNELQDDQPLNTIVIDHLDSIDPSICPNIEIYQNNQDRNVTLATDRNFTTPSADQNWLFHVENVISFTWQTQGGKISYSFLEKTLQQYVLFQGLI